MVPRLDVCLGLSAMKCYECIEFCMSVNPLASSLCSSPFSRFVQLLDSVLCYVIPYPEESFSTFNAFRVSVCQYHLGWCQ